MTRRFGYPNLCPRQKVIGFNFSRKKKKTQNFIGINFKHFDIYMDEKHILTYNLSLKKCYLGSDSSKPNSKPKNNTFQYHKDEKHNKNFAGL